MRAIAMVILLTNCSLSIAQTPVIQTTPTRTTSTLLRGGPGKFDAPRGGGNRHTGVDIVANQTSPNKSLYEVYATADGTVAYARMNGSQTSGFGYTIIVDHRNGHYTLYAHLATNASANIVDVGDNVIKGQTIGYLADPANNELSSGNVRSNVVAQYDKIQLHYELFRASSGRSSTGAIAPIKQGATILDPTSRLKALGYSEF